MIVIEIPKIFESFLDSALVRFQYLYPDIELKRDESKISIKNKSNYSEPDLKQELLHLVYKEKIYSETLEIRNALYRRISDG